MVFGMLTKNQTGSTYCNDGQISTTESLLFDDFERIVQGIDIRNLTAALSCVGVTLESFLEIYYQVISFQPVTGQDVKKAVEILRNHNVKTFERKFNKK